MVDIFNKEDKNNFNDTTLEYTINAKSAASIDKREEEIYKRIKYSDLKFEDIEKSQLVWTNASRVSNTTKTVCVFNKDQLNKIYKNTCLEYAFEILNDFNIIPHLQSKMRVFQEQLLREFRLGGVAVYIAPFSRSTRVSPSANVVFRLNLRLRNKIEQLYAKEWKDTKQGETLYALTTQKKFTLQDLNEEIMRKIQNYSIDPEFIEHVKFMSYFDHMRENDLDHYETDLNQYKTHRQNRETVDDAIAFTFEHIDPPEFQTFRRDFRPIQELIVLMFTNVFTHLHVEYKSCIGRPSIFDIVDEEYKPDENIWRIDNVGLCAVGNDGSQLSGWNDVQVNLCIFLRNKINTL